MIVELFGPPAAGKTTFARTLASRLRETGAAVELVLSFRPAETADVPAEAVPASPALAAMWRLTRPAIEFLGAANPLHGGPPASGIASDLLALLPPGNRVWSVRLRQYITRLEHSWNLAARSEAVVIIDQGFVQAVCSLVLLGRSPLAGNIEKALALIPRPDQLIRVDAPRDVLRARLEARRRGQSWIERMFELDTETSLKSIEILDRLDRILRPREGRGPVNGQDNMSPPRDMIEASALTIRAGGMGAHA